MLAASALCHRRLADCNGAGEKCGRGLDGQGHVLETVVADDLLLDAASGTDEYAPDRPAARHQNLRDGDAGKEVSARSAGEHDRFRRCCFVRGFAHADAAGFDYGVDGLALSAVGVDPAAASKTGGRIQISP